MKVYTYVNPFSINKAEYWDEIRELPQLCISQTLVQGMISCYGRTSFTVISTVQSFLNEFYKEWENSPENDIAQYVELSDQIDKIQDENIKKSMKFNKKEMVEALKYCIELGLEPDKFKVLNEEQKEFINIYKKIKNNAVWNKLDLSVSTEREDDLNEALKELIIKEINKDKELNINKNQTTVEERRKVLEYKIDELKAKNNKTKKKTALRKSSTDRKLNNKINKYKHFIELNEKENLIKEKKIVLHGIHQFTPIIWKMIKHLKDLGIEVIFLINYDRNYKKIYNTWEKVYYYLTGKLSFDKYSLHDNTPHKDIGKNMGELLEGRGIIRSDYNTKFNVFDNLTSFSDYVSERYEEANEVLGLMSKQFYAVNSEPINDILKAQYPDQYGEKHFLSYPVGAFILGLYNMWNADTNQLEIDETNLRECLSVGFWKTNLNTTPISIYERISLYFKNVTTLDEYLQRIESLKRNKASLSKDKELNDFFSKMSFYSVTIEELEYFENILIDLKEISIKVFELDGNNKVNYASHFRNLMKIIREKSEKSSDYIDEAELQLVNEIANKLESSSDLKEVNGSIEDLKESIHFYLSRRKDDRNESANWIVRDFEQIDGGVLLSKEPRNKTYHYAMLSDKNMKGREKQVFKWPLTSEMMKNYDENHPGIELMVAVKKEYKNFLRYSLFYGMYFLNGTIELSFIENSEGEKEVPYFILSMLGLEPKPYETPLEGDTGDILQFQDDIIDNSINISKQDKKIFLICPDKYLYNSIMNHNFYYKNEFQCRYYYIIVLRALTWKRAVGKSYNEACNILESINLKLKKLLPFWREVDFIDIVQKVKYDIQANDLVDNKIRVYDKDYIDNKIHFLLAQIKDDNDKKLMNFFKNNESDIRTFLANNNISKYDNDVNEKICEYCNQREVCLNNFIEGDIDA